MKTYIRIVPQYHNYRLIVIIAQAYSLSILILLIVATSVLACLHALPTKLYFMLLNFPMCCCLDTCLNIIEPYGGAHLGGSKRSGKLPN